jgi:hypothetical protein
LQAGLHVRSFGIGTGAHPDGLEGRGFRRFGPVKKLSQDSQRATGARGFDSAPRSRRRLRGLVLQEFPARFFLGFLRRNPFCLLRWQLAPASTAKALHSLQHKKPRPGPGTACRDGERGSLRRVRGRPDPQVVSAANHSPAVLLRHRGQAVPGPSGLQDARASLRIGPRWSRRGALRIGLGWGWRARLWECGIWNGSVECGHCVSGAPPLHIPNSTLD